MTEKEPFAHLNANGEKIPAFSDNTSVFRHLGKHALYDHCFVEVNENTGVYIWNTNPMYEMMAMLAVQNEAALHLNLREAADIDVKAYIKHHTADKGEFPDWLPEL